MNDIDSGALGPGVRGLRIPGYDERGDLLYKKARCDFARRVVVEVFADDSDVVACRAIVQVLGVQSVTECEEAVNPLHG